MMDRTVFPFTPDNRSDKDLQDAKRKVVFEVYRSLQSRLDAYRQVAILLASASVPIAVFIIGVAQQVLEYEYMRVPYLLFSVAVFGALWIAIDRIKRLFREFSINVQYIEWLAALREPNVYGPRALLMFESQSPPQDGSHPAGWVDPFVQMASIWIVFITLFVTAVEAVLLFVEPG